jgi:hypothetical protein
VTGHKRFRAGAWRLSVEGPPDPITGKPAGLPDGPRAQHEGRRQGRRDRAVEARRRGRRPTRAAVVGRDGGPTQGALGSAPPALAGRNARRDSPTPRWPASPTADGYDPVTVAGRGGWSSPALPMSVYGHSGQRGTREQPMRLPRASTAPVANSQRVMLR